MSNSSLMPSRPLSAATVRRILSSLEDMTQGNVKTANMICELLEENNKTTIDKVLEKIPGKEPTDYLRKFKYRFNQDADGAIAVVFDGRKGPELYFTGIDPVIEDIEDYAKSQANRHTTSEKTVDAFMIEDTKRIYISFSKKDKKWAVSCADLLERTIRAGLRNRYNVMFFRTNQVAVGESISSTLDKMSNDADLAIVLVSNNYLTDRDEADRVLAKHPHPIIVRLEDIGQSVSFDPFDRYDVVSGISFTEAKGKASKQDFANRVLGRVQQKFTSYQPSSYRYISEVMAQDLSAHARFEPVNTPVSAHAAVGTFNSGTAGSFLAVERLVEWSRRPENDNSLLCALLGDLGIGKTTTSILLTRKLLELRKSEEQVPLPIYFDLRDLSPKTLTDFGLRTVLAHLLKVSTPSPVKVDDLLDTIRSENTLVIFDGLDEILVHLSLGDGQRLTRSLLEILTLANSNKEKSAPQTRLLLSCRTQYFRNIKEELAFFDGQGRERVRGEDYIVFTLLPFDEDQIREYLARNIPGADPDRLFEMIRSVHDLGALASQPVMLNMIREVLPSIEKDLSGGARVRSVDLYERFVGQWLTRDDGKHSLIPEHKILLMTHLAWQVWRSGSRTWSARWMEKWMLQFLHSHEEMELDYESRMPHQWKQDFRTATFLSRRGDDFSFAHSSLLEFFLAKRLCDCLFEEEEDQALEVWNITKPSVETFGFLAELIDRLSDIERGQALSCLEQVGKQGTVVARTNVFTYTLMALERSLPYPRPGTLDLSGTDLRKWTIGSKGASLDLRGVSFKDARLDDTRFNHVCLDCVNASRASMQRAVFEYCRMSNVDFNDTDLSGTIFRHCDLSRTSLEKAKRHRTQLLYTSGYKQGLSGVLVAPLLDRSELKILPKTQIFSGYVDGVTALAWSPDGSRIATGSDDGVRVWDAVTGEDLFSLEYSRLARSVAWSPDGSRIATGSDEGVRVWDAVTGEDLFSLECGRGVGSVAWSPDGRRIVTGSDEGVRVWDAVTGESLFSLKRSRLARSVAWSPDGSRIATASAGGVRVWDAVTGESLFSLKRSRLVDSVVWSPDGSRIATASAGGVRVWDAVTGKELLSLERGHRVKSVVWSPDGSRIATASAGGVRVWDAVTGAELLSLGYRRLVRSVVWSPDGSRIATASDDGVRVLDAVTGAELLSLGYRRLVRSVVWSPDGSRIATASDDGVRVLDAVTGESLFSLEYSRLVRSVVWSPDGSRIATASDDGVWVLDAVTGESLFSLKRSLLARSVAWSPDGSRIATASVGGVWVWDAVTGAELLSLGYSLLVDSVVWSPDGSRIAAGSAGGVRVLDAVTGESLFSLKRSRLVRSVVWSPDGSRIATASDDGVRVLDAVTGESLFSLEYSRLVRSVVWSPDGSRIVTSSIFDDLRVLDAVTGESLFSLEHGSRVDSVAWSPDGSRIATGSAGGVWVLDAVTGESLFSLEHGSRVDSVAWSPDGKRILTKTRRNEIRIWDVTSGEQVSFFITPLPEGERVVLSADQTKVIGASAGAWRWLGRLAVLPDGKLERIPVEIDGPLPPLGADAEVE